jgi:hypothetical protein
VSFIKTPLTKVASGGSIFGCHKPYKWVNFALPQPKVDAVHLIRFIGRLSVLNLQEIVVRPVRCFEEADYQQVMQKHHYLGWLPKGGGCTFLLNKN